MPFKSEKQRKYLWANEPEIASRWTREYGSKPVRGKKKKKASSLLSAWKDGQRKLGG